MLEDDRGLGSLATCLASTLAGPQLVGMVGRMVAREQVAWRGLLALVTTSMSTLPGAEAAWCQLVSQLVSAGLQEEEGEARFVAGLLIARRVADQHAPSFPSYAAWFHSAFGEDTSSLAAGSPGTLLLHLSSLVPWEPAAVLKTHLSRPPWLPVQLKSQWEDYRALARSRAMELGEVGGLAEERARPSHQALREVAVIVEEWGTTAKLPKFVSYLSYIPMKHVCNKGYLLR